MGRKWVKSPYRVSSRLGGSCFHLASKYPLRDVPRIESIPGSPVNRKARRPPFPRSPWRRRRPCRARVSRKRMREAPNVDNPFRSRGIRVGSFRTRKRSGHQYLRHCELRVLPLATSPWSYFGGLSSGFDLSCVGSMPIWRWTPWYDMPCCRYSNGNCSRKREIRRVCAYDKVLRRH